MHSISRAAAQPGSSSAGTNSLVHIGAGTEKRAGQGNGWALALGRGRHRNLAPELWGHWQDRPRHATGPDGKEDFVRAEPCCGFVRHDGEFEWDERCEF